MALESPAMVAHTISRPLRIFTFLDGSPVYEVEIEPLPFLTSIVPVRPASGRPGCNERGLRTAPRPQSRITSGITSRAWLGLLVAGKRALVLKAGSVVTAEKLADLLPEEDL